MTYTPKFIIFFAVNRYLDDATKEKLKKEIGNYDRMTDARFIKVIEKYFNFQRMLDSPMVPQDVWIFNYLMYETKRKDNHRIFNIGNKIEFKGRLPRKGLIAEYEGQVVLPALYSAEMDLKTEPPGPIPAKARTLSNWQVDISGKLGRINDPFASRAIEVFHLDDHKLITAAIKNILQGKFLVNHMQVGNGTEALEYLKSNYNKGKTIDLIISDLNHPGLHGLAFAREWRAFEGTNNLFRIPMLILTMVDREHIPVEYAADTGLVDAYMSKLSDGAVILQAVEDMLYREK